jgi:hypothetical protein
LTLPYNKSPTLPIILRTCIEKEDSFLGFYIFKKWRVYEPTQLSLREQAQQRN